MFREEWGLCRLRVAVACYFSISCVGFFGWFGCAFRMLCSLFLSSLAFCCYSGSWRALYGEIGDLATGSKGIINMSHDYLRRSEVQFVGLNPKPILDEVMGGYTWRMNVSSSTSLEASYSGTTVSCGSRSAMISLCSKTTICRDTCPS